MRQLFEHRRGRGAAPASPGRQPWQRGPRLGYAGHVDPKAACELFLLLILAATVFGIVNWLAKRKRWAKQDQPRTTIAAGAPGVRGRFLGRVEAGPEPLVAPVRRRPCVAFETVVYGRWRTTVKVGYGYREVHVDHPLGVVRRSSEFLVVDETGAMAVDPKGVPWELIKDVGKEAETEVLKVVLDLMPAEDRVKVESRAPSGAVVLALQDAWFLGYVLKEGAIEPGELTQVEGCPELEVAPSTDGYRESKRLALRGGLAKLICDPTQFTCPSPIFVPEDPPAPDPPPGDDDDGGP